MTCPDDIKSDFFLFVAAGDLPAVRRVIAAWPDALAWKQPDKTALPDMQALHIAAMSGRQEMVEALVAAGAEVEGRDRFGQTPLMLAIQHHFPGIAEYLLGRGAQANAACSGDITPLMFAAQVGSIPGAQLLLENGALIDAVCDNGSTALFFARSAGEKARETTRFLLEQGADPRKSNASGYTAEQDAYAYGLHEMGRFIRDCIDDVESRKAAAVMRDQEVLEKGLPGMLLIRRAPLRLKLR